MHIVKLLLVFGANMNSLDSRCLTPLDKAVEYNFEKAKVLLQSIGAVESKEAINCNFETCLPRLKSFHDTAKAKERLKQLRMKSLSARRRYARYSTEAELGVGQSVSAVTDELCNECEEGPVKLDKMATRNDSREYEKSSVACGENGVGEDGCDGGHPTRDDIHMDKPTCEDEVNADAICPISPGGNMNVNIFSRERTLTNQSLDNMTLGDMEDGRTLLTLSQRIDQYIEIKFNLSS